MGNFLKALNFTVFFVSIMLLLEVIGISIFAGSLFTLFGAFFLFLSVWNEIELISL